MLSGYRWLIAAAALSPLACDGEDSSGVMTIDGGGNGGGVGGSVGGSSGGNTGGARVSASGTIDVEVDIGETVALRYRSFGDLSLEPLVLHFGGPGLSAVEQLDAFVGILSDAVLDALTERYVLVALEEIGVGQSVPVDCPWNLSVDDVTEAELLSSATEFATDCEETYDRFEDLDTARYARDLEAMRTALEFSTLSFYGYSYGARVALTYGALFPATAGALVLDSTLDPRDSFAELNAAQSVGLSRALQAFFDDCDRDLSCTFGFGNAEFAFNNLLNRFSSPALREEATALSVTVTQGLGEERRWPGLASTLEQIDQGVLTPALASDPNKGQGDGTFFGTSCADSPIGSIQDLRAAEQLINAGEPVFVRNLYASMFPCVVWGATSPTIDWDTALGALNDVLIVGTDGDAITPVELADALADDMPGANRLISPEFSHAIGLLGVNPCVDDAILDFLIDDRRTDTRCPRPE